MLELAKEMKVIVDDSAQYPTGATGDDIKGQTEKWTLSCCYTATASPVANDEVYKERAGAGGELQKYQS